MSSEMIPLLPPSHGGEDGSDGRPENNTSTGSLCRRQFNSLRRAGLDVPLLIAAVLLYVAVTLLSTIHQSTTASPSSLDDLNNLHPANVTFRELAKMMLPPAYDDMRDALLPLLLQQQQQPHLHPGQVHDTRKVILRTRDLLDVFSPVYPIYQHQPQQQQQRRREINETDGVDDCCDCDLWRILRQMTSKLYEKVGEFQDLHYAQHTSHDIAHHRRNVVYRLVDTFFQTESIRDSQMHDYLSAATHGCFKRNESHLFWPTTASLPAGRDYAMPSLRSLGVAQTRHALEYLTETLSYEHDGLVNDTVHATFHNLRKEMRSLTDEYDLFANYSSSSSSYSGSGGMKYIMFPPAASEPNMIPLLKEAHLVLGSLNNDFVGLEIYTTQSNNESQPEEEEMLRERIKQGWESFCTWVKEVQLEQSLMDLATLLETR